MSNRPFADLEILLCGFDSRMCRVGNPIRAVVRLWPRLCAAMCGYQTTVWPEYISAATDAMWEAGGTADGGGRGWTTLRQGARVDMERSDSAMDGRRAGHNARHNAPDTQKPSHATTQHTWLRPVSHVTQTGDENASSSSFLFKNTMTKVTNRV